MTDAAIKPGDPIDVIYGDRRFVAWRYERGANGQAAKIPYTPGLGAKARSNDPMTWRSHAEAQATFEKGAVDGISDALMQRDGLAALDLDHPTQHRVPRPALAVAGYHAACYRHCAVDEPLPAG